MQQLARYVSILLLGWSSLTFGKSFTIGTLEDPYHIYPLFQLAGDATSLRQLTNPPILSVRNDGRIVCILCKDIPEFETRREEEGAEAISVISLELKKKLTWADGTPITPLDVKFTLEAMAKADYDKGTSPMLPIRRIELDPDQKNKLRLVLTHRRTDAYQLFAISLLPAHKADLIQRLQKEPHDAAWWQKLQDPGLYYGAYVVKSASAERWQLVSNKEGSWEDAPTQDIEIRTFNGLPALAKAMQASELDQTAEGELTWLKYLELRSLVPSLDQKFSLQSRPGNTLELVLLNLRSPLLVNPQLRQILQHAIQRETLTSKILGGHGSPAFSFLHPLQLEKLGEKTRDPYQPQRVAQLLEQTGAKRSADGVLTIDGQKISLVLSCSDVRLKSGLYQPLVDDLKKIGVEVRVDSIPEDEYIRQTLAHRRFKDMACMRWQLPALTPPMNLMHSLAIPNAENNYFGLNFSGWDQGIVDRILESLQKDAEISQVQRLLSRLDKQFMSELPGLPLVYLPDLWLNRNDKTNKDMEETQQKISLYPAVMDIPSRRRM